MNPDEFLFAAAIGTIALTNKQHVVNYFSARLYPSPFYDCSNTDDQYNTTAKFTSLKLVLIQHIKFVGFSYNVLSCGTESTVVRFTCYKVGIL
jgi:hypothetical protein